jgi:hypothetical protein
MAGVIDALSARPPGTASSAPAPTGPVFVAEWLEFELRAPGGQPEVTRRPLVDRSSPTWRTKRPLNASELPRLGRADKGPTAMRALHNVWFSGGPHNLADYAEAVQDLAYKTLDQEYPERSTTASPAEEPEFGDSVWPFALQNFAWMIWTDHGVVPRLNDTAGLRFYAARPRIAVFTMMTDRSGLVQLETDLRRDDLRAVAEPSIATSLVAEKKLWFGVMEGAFEHEMLADTVAATGGDRAAVETTSARLGADGVLVLTPSDPLPSGARAPHSDSAARVTAVLAAGRTVVAPAGALDARGSWWEIAPGTGDTAAVGPLELHRARAPYNPNYQMPKGTKGPQQNPYGGQKPQYSPDRVDEARKAQKARDVARRTAENEKKMADAAEKYRQKQSQLGRQAQSRKSGDEYGVLTTVVMVIGAVAYTVVGLAVSYATFMAVEAAISSLSE